MLYWPDSLLSLTDDCELGRSATAAPLCVKVLRRNVSACPLDGSVAMPGVVVSMLAPDQSIYSMWLLMNWPSWPEYFISRPSEYLCARQSVPIICIDILPQVLRRQIVRKRTILIMHDGCFPLIPALPFNRRQPLHEDTVDDFEEAATAAMALVRIWTLRPATRPHLRLTGL